MERGDKKRKGGEGLYIDEIMGLNLLFEHWIIDKCVNDKFVTVTLHLPMTYYIVWVNQMADVAKPFLQLCPLHRSALNPA